MEIRKIVRDNYTVEFSDPEIYVDNKSRHRSGHMSHALAEFAPGCFIDFNSNCSDRRWTWGGHSPYGWIEYRISRDAGKTYSDIQKLPFAWESFLDGNYMISVEKAVACDDGSIVAFCLRNDAIDPSCCEPWYLPAVVISHDEGKTWSEPMDFSPYNGRTYAALYRDGVIYALHFCNPNFFGKDPENHKYRLYVSLDNGKSFEERSVVPFNVIGRSYCTMFFDSDGLLHAYAYNGKTECDFDHAVSRDNGVTWEVTEPCYLNYGIRNPQINCVNGVYILHGRAGQDRTKYKNGFVFYTSEDAVHWDEGTYYTDIPGGAYYSNNIKLTDENGEFLLVQYSSPYDSERTVESPHDTENKFVQHCVNVSHLTLRVKRN